MSEEKVVIVTGGNRGIGRAVAEALAEQGHRVIATCRDVERGRQSLSHRPEIDVRRLEVTEQADIDALKAHAKNSYGRVDVLINNAGIAVDQWVKGLEVDIDLVRQTLETNVIGALRCCQAFVPPMIEAGYGRVVNVGSELGSLEKMEMAGSIGYRASKTGLHAITRLLALEAAGAPDVKINAACPGWVKTDLGGPDAPRSPEEGADTIVWLALLDKNGPNGGLFRDRAPYPW